MYVCMYIIVCVCLCLCLHSIATIYVLSLWMDGFLVLLWQLVEIVAHVVFLAWALFAALSLSVVISVVSLVFIPR